MFEQSRKTSTAHTEGNFPAQSVTAPFSSTFFLCVTYGSFISLFASIPPQSCFLTPLLDDIKKEICNLLIYKNRKTRHHGISKSSKPVYSNPNILKDRKLRFQGEIDLHKGNWEMRISSHWNQRAD